MSDHKGLGDQNQTPDDVATLYSWANLHGAKYRDFTASRAQTRESARLRLQAANEAQLQQGDVSSKSAMTTDAQRTGGAELTILAEHEAAWVAQQEAQLSAQLAARQAAEDAAYRAAQVAEEKAHQEAAMAAYEAAGRRAAQEAALRDAEEAERQAAQHAARLAAVAAELKAAQLAAVAAEQAAHRAAQQPAWQYGQAEHHSAISQPVQASPAAQYEPPPPKSPFQPSDNPGFEKRLQGYAPPPQSFMERAGPGSIQPPAPAPMRAPIGTPLQLQQGAVRRESSGPANTPWAPSAVRDASGRPAWLTPVTTGTPAQPPAPGSQPVAPGQAGSEDTLQGSRDRLASRWFALRGVFSGDPAPAEAVPPPLVSRAPVMAVFSLAGGVGKTSLVATLGRALSARGERVLLMDTASFGVLPFFFGARDKRPGQLRTFSPPGVNSDAPIQMISIDPDSLGPESAGSEAGDENGLSGEVSRYARGGVSRVIVDLATASGATTRRLMRVSPMILVPVIPDMNSVVSVGSIDDFFAHNSAGGSTPPLYYVMNQFDPSMPLHLDVREVLREQLGDRLLTFAIRRAPVMSEALAEGMTVMDYAPNSGVAEDFGTLAGWVKSLSAPASTTYRGVRWSER